MCLQSANEAEMPASSEIQLDLALVAITLTTKSMTVIIMKSARCVEY